MLTGKRTFRYPSRCGNKVHDPTTASGQDSLVTGEQSRFSSRLSRPDPDTTYEFQLKGAGRTPFSRSAGGIAVLRLSILTSRSGSYACVGIPTTRSLALLFLPGMPVIHERLEKACVTTRVTETFIRIGNLEALSPPSRAMFFFGGGQQHADYEALRILAEWTVKRVPKLDNVNPDKVAAWQAYGFIHGAINTDKQVSRLRQGGSTKPEPVLHFVLGPYAFMDAFDSHHICNHSDQEDRPCACRALLDALAPLIDAEIALGNKAVQRGWADDVSDEIISEWRAAGIREVGATMNQIIESTCTSEYGTALRRHLTLRRVDPSDQHTIFQPLLDMMENHRLDFHGTFRKLVFFRPNMLLGDDDSGATALEGLIAGLLGGTPEPERLDAGKATKEWLAWLDTYAARIESEKTSGEWGEDFDETRERAAMATNPRFVVRQWLLEEVIKKVEDDPATGKHVLAKVMQMICSPFEPWGREGDLPDEESSEEEKEERQYCGLGDSKMLGF
ncbi:hypothetical protein PISMIDRAFT_14984 [Pisolithus microcarpus 441]|uniref:Selenoprotein O n=1 Tax=Pisolithus microcarpus 441 TaxID=765257 RepID=A0A0C9XYS2_9AGAM|nr:hypothetical protein PISMIDRAFT_14984 [Pisolithus microcarpus 441]